MAYEVLARTWRPKQFDDVVGQGHVTRTLMNAIENGRVGHAYLFVGPRGVGKTTLTRIFAKALNCVDGPTGTPCDACDACLEIAAGNCLDVMEIDGASNNGVEQVRDLRESVRFSPTRCRFKIVTIDEVHMLSPAAFNALLKTLEEPPPHVKFFFATTEADKVLPTIISRCQRFDLRRIPATLIVDRLQRIVEQQRIEAEPAALLAVARSSEGGMRDALSALDQLIAFTGQQIREADVLSVFGLIARQALEQLAGSVLAGDIPAALQTVHSLDETGKDLRRLAQELLEHFRNVLIVQHSDAADAMSDVTESELAELRRQAGLADSARVVRITEALVDLEGRMRYALSQRTLLEMTLIRCARAATVASIDELLRRLVALRNGEMQQTAKPQPPAAKASPEATARSATPPGAETETPAVADAPVAAAPPNALLDDPVVRQALSMFKGQVLDVRA